MSQDQANKDLDGWLAGTHAEGVHETHPPRTHTSGGGR